MAPALVVRKDRISYKQLNLRIAALAGWLRGQGLVPGDRVAIWLGKTDIACIMPLAAARAGLVHVPVNPLLKAPQVAHIMADSGAKLLIANRQRLNLVDTNSANYAVVEDKALSAAMTHNAETADQWLKGSGQSSDALAAILYTSGSTGRPKGVMLSHANMWLGAVSVAQYLGLGPDDRTLCVLPLSFDYGQNQLFSTWMAGGCCYPLDYLMPRDVLKAMASHAITTLAAVPPLWLQLTEHDWPEGANAHLRRMTNSGGALTEPLVRRLRALAPDADLVAMYGLTEAFRSTYLDPSQIDMHPGAIGRAIPFAEILLVDADGNAIRGEGEGELVHCGPLVAQGYWQDSTRTAKRFRAAPAGARSGGLAVWSGDTARRDGDGLLYFVGRDDAMIKTSGNRVSPNEVEEAALATGLVAEAIAFGVADDALGQAIIVVARAARNSKAIEPKAIISAMKADVPNFMLPQEIVLRDTLPRNANGKIDRVELEKEFLVARSAGAAPQ